jgi:hypothetical protein
MKQQNTPLDFAEEVRNQASLGHAVDLGVDVLDFEASIVAFAISIIIRVIDNVNQAVIVHATCKCGLDNLGVLAPPNLTWHSGEGSIAHLDIIVRPVEIILQEESTAQIMLDVTRTPPSIAV